MANVQRIARTIAVLILLTAVFGGLGESYIPGRIIISNDAAATARNIVEHPLLYRLGFATYLLEAVCDIALAVLFYVLLRPGGRNLALISAFLGVFSTATYAVAEMFYFAPGLLLNDAAYLKTFTPEQLNTLALFLMKVSGRIGYSFILIYGVATMIRGFLMYRLRIVPRALGALFMIGGAAFVAQGFATVLAPAYTSPYFLAPVALGGILLMLWLFVKGVDEERLRAATAS